MVEAVLFDMDGIIIDSEIWYMKGTYDLIKSLGFKGKLEDVFCLIGTTMEITYKMLEKMLDYRYTIEELAKLNDEYFRIHKLQYHDIVFEGVHDTLKEFKENNLKLALCSSSPINDIKNCIRELDIEQYFDLVVSGDDFKQSKPNPEIYLFALKHLNVKSENAIVYEDSTMGIEAGKNASIYTVARKETRFNLDQSMADAIVNDIYEFKNLVLNRKGTKWKKQL